MEDAVGDRALDSGVGFGLLVNAVQDYAFLILDPDGIVTGWNPGAQRLKGYSAQEILGRHISVFYPEEDVRSGKVEHELAEARRLGRFEDESWRIRKDGSRFWANVIITALVDDDGTLRGFGKVTRDMSERRQFEQDLEAARESAAAANRAKDEFLSSMSHELRTPLNAVIGFAQLLAMDPLSAEQHDSVGHIVKAGKHLLDLINDVLDISRIASGQMSLSPESVSLTEVITEAVAMVTPLAANRAIRLTAEDANGLHVLVDRQRIKQVLLNLLSNAIKYSFADGAVEVSWAKGDLGRLLIRVSDTGAGIPESMMDRMFRPFDRLGADGGDIEGTGLGLALSKGLVEAMGGQLTAVSTVGQGSTFTIDLPLTEPPIERLQRETRETQRRDGRSGAQTSVVYIEDNLSNLHLVERILQRRPDIDIIPAQQGRLGLELAIEHHPALVLLDLHLPDTSGEDVLRQLKGHPNTAKIPVAIMSADASPGRMARLLEAGAIDYITKPIDINAFLALIDRWCVPDSAEMRIDGSLSPG
jgi:PAS domain S-box-containing protein